MFFFDVLDRLLERRDKDLRLSQAVFRQLEFRNQHTGLVHNNQPKALFHRHTLFEVIQYATKLTQ